MRRTVNRGGFTASLDHVCMNRVSRRRMLTVAGVIGAAPVAGCLGDSTEFGEAWEDVDRIELLASAQNWIGVSPEVIDDRRNPTLVLVQGRTYDIEIENADGNAHQLRILNTNEDTIAESDTVDQLDARTTVQVDAAGGLAQYFSTEYEATTTGEIQIFSP